MFPSCSHRAFVPPRALFVRTRNNFDADTLEIGGNNVRPDYSFPNKSGTKKLASQAYRLLWWYWQALKRNHVLLAPFLAPYHSTRGHSYRSASLMVKYAATVASVTILYHLVRTNECYYI